MGASKESPATQILEWAVGKLDEASKTDWVDKLNTLTQSKPAYLRNFVPAAAPSSLPAPAPAPAPSGPSQADVEAALARASRAEAKAETLARKVEQLERTLAGGNSHRDPVVTLPDDEGAHDDEHHKSHGWSRHH
jgi:hypothetical protein